MPIPVVCPKCKKRGEVVDSYVGQEAECPGCGHNFKVALPNDSAPDLIQRQILVMLEKQLAIQERLRSDLTGLRIGLAVLFLFVLIFGIRISFK